MSAVTAYLPDDWRAWQAEQWIKLKRFNVEVVHRGAGKSVFACIWLLVGALTWSGSVGAYVGPLLKQTRMNIWPLWKRLAGQVPGVSFNETELRTDFPNGSRVHLLGTENAHAIRGATLKRAVLDEVAQIGPIAWGQVIFPALNRPGDPGEALAIGTVNGMAGLFYELYEQAGSNPEWHRAYLQVTDTGLYSPEEITRLKANMSAEDFAQEFMLDWNASMRGSYWGKEMAEAERAGRIARVPHDPLLKVHTSLDLGIRHAFVVWLWQCVGAEIRAIGCRAYVGSSIPDIWSDLTTLKYNWGRHYAPHDSKVRELGTGKSRLETARALGWKWEEVPEIGLKAGIEAVRNLIPRIWFDREGCKAGIEGLKLYRPEYNDVAGVYSLQPMDSWANDFADALRMFAVGSQGKVDEWPPIDYSLQDRGVI